MGRIIVKHDNPNYLAKWRALPEGSRYNGAYYYSKDIEKYIVPNIKTDRPINVIGVRGCGGKHRMIVFIHHYLHPEMYDWLKRYRDIIIVGSDKEFLEKLSHLGKTIHLPLSVNVEEIEKHKVKKKTKDACYMGNPWKFKQQELSELLPEDVDKFPPMPKEQLWDEVAKYKYCYAIGLCAIEAQVLGCKLKMSRYRYPHPAKSFPVLDCKDAAKILQEKLDEIDGLQ